MLAALATGCEKSARHEREEAAIAGSKVEHTGKAVVHELEHGDAKSLDRALKQHVEAIDDLQAEQDEAIAAAAKERASYKQLLEKEIGWIDQRISELENETARATPKGGKEAKAKDLAAARDFRILLRRDLDDIESSGETAWPPLKERIDHDLEDERPKAVPRSFDKSYGI